jgi:hypothetical protein
METRPALGVERPSRNNVSPRNDFKSLGSLTGLDELLVRLGLAGLLSVVVEVALLIAPGAGGSSKAPADAWGTTGATAAAADAWGARNTTTTATAEANAGGVSAGDAAW